MASPQTARLPEDPFLFELINEPVRPPLEVIESLPKDISELFPLPAENINNLLGDYNTSSVPEISSLYMLNTVLYSSRQKVFESQSKHPELGVVGMANDMHRTLIARINASFINLIRDGWDEQDSIRIIDEHIHTRGDMLGRRYARKYSDFLGALVINKLGYNVLPANIFPEVYMSIEELKQTTITTYNRFERLRFEVFSAENILLLLQRSIERQKAS